MIELLTPELMSEVSKISESPCVSLYMTTHKKHPENQIDPKKFKELVAQCQDSLLAEYSEEEVNGLLARLHELAEDFQFWQNTMNGLAVLRTENYFKVIGLQTPLEELVVVANSFHTKPLRKYLQSLESYQVLGITLQDVHFFEGNRHSLTEVDLSPKVPTTINDALGAELTEKYVSISSGGSGANGINIQHGHGGKSDEMDKDAERFFTVVSRAIAENYSKSGKLPLILAALPEHHNLFQKVSNNPFLLEHGITINPKAVSIEKLKDLAWDIIEPLYFERLNTAADAFQQSKANKLGTDDMEQVAKAAAEGRVSTLLLEADRVIAGKITRESGKIERSDLDNPLVDDLLDDIGELVSGLGGEVIVVPADKMPTDSGVAATLRY